MATITTRAGKGSPLTNTEVDANFTNLNTEATAAYGWGNHASAGYITSDANTTYTGGTGITLSGTTFNLTDTNAKLNLTGGTVSGDIAFGDNDKATFGAGGDLSIYHDGSNGRIRNSVGTLKIQATSNGENGIELTPDGKTALFHNGVEKIATTSTGIDVTGQMQADSAYITGSLTFPDGQKIKMGASEDLQIYHDGSNSVIREVGTGALEIQTNGAEIQLTGNAGTDYMLRAISNGAVKLYYDNSTKLATTSAGVNVTGTVTATGGNSTNWNTAYGWGNHASGGYLAASHDMTVTLTGDVTGTAVHTNMGTATISTVVADDSHNHTTLHATDNRTISPSELSASKLRFGFTSWANNNTSPYADYLHFRTYADSSGGKDNLLMFKKSSKGMRLWQQTFGSATAYSSYVDIWDTGTLTTTNKANYDTAYGWGDHGTQSYATQSYVGTQISNLVDSSPAALNTLNELAAALGDNPNFATTVTDSIATKLPLAGGTMTGAINTNGSNIVVASGTGLSTTGTETRFTTAHGYIQLGPMNTSYAHIYTNISGGFYFNNTNLYANGNHIWHAGDFANNSTNWNTAYTVANAAAPKAGATFTGQVNVNYSASKFVVGGTTVTDTSDANRPNITLKGGVYPHMTIDSRNAANNGTNTNHGPVFSFVQRLSTSGFRRFSIGTAGYNGDRLSFGYADNNANPHYGMGTDGTGAMMYLTTGAQLIVNSSVSTPIVYDKDNTAYYVNPASTSVQSAIDAASYVKAANVSITSGDANGIGFWDGTTGGSGSYAIYMSSQGGSYAGRVAGDTTSDYNMYFKMSAGTNRGFVFKNGASSVAGIDGAGNGRFGGTIASADHTITSGTNGTNTLGLLFALTDNADAQAYIKKSAYYMHYNAHYNEGHRFTVNGSDDMLRMHGSNNGTRPDSIDILAGNGLYMNNTQIIDASRNLTNIGSISSGTITAGINGATDGGVTLRNPYSGNNTLNQLGTIRSTGGWYMSYGLRQNGANGNWYSTFTNFSSAKSVMEHNNSTIVWSYAAPAQNAVDSVVSVTPKITFNLATGSISSGAITSSGDIKTSGTALGVTQTDGDYLSKLYQVGADGVLELFTGQATPLSRIKLHSYSTSYINPASGGLGVGVTTVGSGQKLNVGGGIGISGTTVIDASRNVTTPNVYLNNTSTRLSQSTGSALRITTPTGHIDIGSMNGGWVHFQGSLPYYFNQPLHMDNHLYPYSTAGARNLGGTGNVWNHVYAKGYFIDSTEVIDASRNLTNINSLSLVATVGLKFLNTGTGTYNHTEYYHGQNNTSGNNANGMFIEMARLSDSGSAEVRQFVVGARGGQIQFRVDGSGNTFSASSSRATMFYDQNNTTYYADPASATTSLRTVGDWRSNSGNWSGEFAGKIQYHSNNWYLQASGEFIFRNGGGANVHTTDTNGHTTSIGSLRAPIFYDSDNTAYYTNPASTSNLNVLRLAGSLAVGGHTDGAPSNLATSGVIAFGSLSADAVANYCIKTTLFNFGGTYNKLDFAFHTGIRMGAHPNYGGVRFFSDQSMGTEIASIGKSGNYVDAVNSIRAPVFYDNNNTAYYADFNATGTSIKAAGITDSKTGFKSTANPWNTGDSAYFPNGITTANTTNWIYGHCFLGGAVSNGSGNDATAGGTIESTSWHKATSYIDRDNTAYYLDPAGGTSLKIAGNIAGNSSDTSEIGAYGAGAIKRIRMRQGGEIHFGDTTTGSALGLTEGTWNQFTDTDRLGLYYRNELKMYSNSNVLRHTFDVSGNYTAVGNITAYSDIRLKDDIQPIEDAVSKVQKLNGVTYFRNDNDDENRQAGLIAQDVELVLPEAVREMEDGIKTVNYNATIGLLVEAIKELTAKVETLETQLSQKEK